MVSFILRRILSTLPVMIIVAIVVFAMLRLTPGDPAVVIAGDQATAEQIARIRSNLGLDLPIHVQFFTWIGQLMQGDLGISIFTNMPVSTLIAQRLEPTLLLSLTTICFSVLVAVPLGVWAAWRSGTWTGLFRSGLFLSGFRFGLSLDLPIRLDAEMVTDPRL